MTLKLAYNTTSGPVLADSAGFVIGGHEWGPVDSTDQIALDAFARDDLIDADEDALAASDNEVARAAVASLQSRRDREQAARALDKDALAEALPAEVVEELPLGGDGKPSKDDLVDAATADPEVELPQADAEPDDDTPAKSSRRPAAKK